MKVAAWNNGQWHASGAGYGIKLRLDSRDKHFSRTWPYVKIRLEGNGVITVPLSTSFWNLCPELRKQEIGRWMLSRGFSSWSPGQPPEFELTPCGNRTFKLSVIAATAIVSS